MTFMIVVLVLGAIILVLLSSIAIRERKYEIGVLRAMGMKKAKVALGLWFEMIIITAFCLIIGIFAGSLAAQPISTGLLAQQEENTQNIQDSFFAGRDLASLSRVVNDDPITEIDVTLGIDTILQIMLISLLLASVAGLAAISTITKYEPIKILMERG
jgi:putative ABC transport system permease protein